MSTWIWENSIWRQRSSASPLHQQSYRRKPRLWQVAEFLHNGDACMHRNASKLACTTYSCSNKADVIWFKSWIINAAVTLILPRPSQIPEKRDTPFSIENGAYSTYRPGSWFLQDSNNLKSMATFQYIYKSSCLILAFSIQKRNARTLLCSWNCRQP